MGNGQKYRQTLLAAVLAIAMLGVAYALGVTIVGHATADSTPLVATVLGFLAPVVVGLLALLKAEKVDKRLDGALQQLVHDEVQEQLPAEPPARPARRR